MNTLEENVPSLRRRSSAVRHLSFTNTAELFPRTVQSIAAAVLSLALCGCGALKASWGAPEKREAIQVDLELIGKVDAPHLETTLSSLRSSLEQHKSLPRVRSELKASLPLLSESTFANLWSRVVQQAGIPGSVTTHLDARAQESLLAAIRSVFGNSLDDNALYEAAIGANASSAAVARNQLLARYVVRIQDYHEANYEDVFAGSAGWGVFLDFGALLSSALATAFTPVSTKTALSAAAAVFSGTRLAADKNVLNERSAAAVLNVMVASRQAKLNVIRAGMKDTIGNYPMDVGLIDLGEFLNEGGLYKALATLEQESEAARRKAEEEAHDIRNPSPVPPKEERE